ncbi:4a-hydroxytetrahydrobiopterin dehydratase [Isoptericola sp. BMS4]|uniref:4a-hydroxytetrahydrobiopterin dehydratase n=1 Tax=Isoptericola sp. BMS4 TaxID=2527875 RepID=UPI0014202775|nr:4a-hydroxytetrahydrobiopterin dehydratase [Isoptericola sp. BMS4]
MTDQITTDEFGAADGVADWRVRDGSAEAVFRTGSFAAGVRLVDEIGEIADALDHHPDVDLRYGAVTVRTWSHDVGGLTRRDTELARRVSEAARELDIPADPAGA